MRAICPATQVAILAGRKVVITGSEFSNNTALLGDGGAVRAVPQQLVVYVSHLGQISIPHNSASLTRVRWPSAGVLSSSHPVLLMRGALAHDHLLWRSQRRPRRCPCPGRLQLQMENRRDDSPFRSRWLWLWCRPHTRLHARSGSVLPKSANWRRRSTSRSSHTSRRLRLSACPFSRRLIGQCHLRLLRGVPHAHPFYGAEHVRADSERT